MGATLLRDIISNLESGSRPKGGALTDKGIPSLGAEHLTSCGTIDFKNKKYVPLDYFKNLRK